MLKEFKNLIMNATQQLKRLHKSRQNEEKVLEGINAKLDLILAEIEKLKNGGQHPNLVDSGKIEKVSLGHEVDEFYIPNVETDNMEVNAKTKTLSGSDVGDIESKIEKLNKLGG